MLVFVLILISHEQLQRNELADTVAHINNFLSLPLSGTTNHSHEITLTLRSTT